MTAASTAPSRALRRNRSYLLLVGAQGASVLGGQIMTMALPLLVLGLTGSPTHAGLAAAVGAAPHIVLSLAAGALVDRWDRRTVLLVCVAVRAAVLLWVPVAHELRVLEVTQLYALSLLNGTAFVFFNIAELSVLPELVDKAQLSRASSVNAVVESTAALTGPGLGGALVALGGSPVDGGALAFLTAGIAYAAATGPLLLLPRGQAPKPGTRQAGAPETAREAAGAGWRARLVREIAEGLGFLWRHRDIRRIALTSAALNLLFSPCYLAVLVLARDELHASEVYVGLIFSLGGAGGILGGILASRIAGRRNAPGVIVGSVLAWAAVMPLLPAARAPETLIAGWILVTLISPVYDVTQLSYRLSMVPDGLQGRVNSTFRFIAWGLRPLAMGLGGVATSALGPRALLWTCAGGMALLAVAVLVGGPRTTKVPSPAVEDPTPTTDNRR
ncbi:MFS transporter [Streptomyces noursei]|uniref:MFS transporter n=1 Tax=Streptomyces noursei TaxID=1971 RepID=UPI0030F13773